MYVQYGRLLAYSYDPRGCMWHVQARPYGSSRQQDVDIRDERARLSSRMRKRSGEVVVSTTDDVSRCRRIDRLSPGLVSFKLTRASVWTPTSYQHYSRFSGYHTPDKSGVVIVLFGSPTNNLYMPDFYSERYYDQNFCGNQWSFSFLATSCSTFWTLVR
jgi:hypothetical protein